MRLLLASFLVIASVLAQAPAHPDFSGHWQLASATGTTPPGNLALDIEQATTAIQIKAAWQEPPGGSYGLTTIGIVTPLARFTTDGQEDLNQVGPFVFHSRTRWDGARLVTSWNTSEFQGHAFKGTWTRALSAGGRELTLEIAASDSGATSTRAVLVFHR